MSEIRIIESVLERTAQRRRWQRAWKGLWQGLLVGSCLWLLALLVYKLLPVSRLALGVGAAAAALAMLAGFIWGWRRKLSLLETARWLDDQKNLQERLSTALELSSAKEGANWRELLVSDAAKHATQLNPKTLLPYHLPAASRWAVLTLALAVGL